MIRYLKFLAFTSAFVMAGFVSGCSESKTIHTINFKEQNYPADVANVSGISGAESWGRWTDGPQAVVQFKEPLPVKFRLRLQVMRAFGPNEKLPFTARAGNVQREFTVTGPGRPIAVDFAGVENANRIELNIPRPTSPKELNMSGDPRKLGIGLVSLTIER